MSKNSKKRSLKQMNDDENIALSDNIPTKKRKIIDSNTNQPLAESNNNTQLQNSDIKNNNNNSVNLHNVNNQNASGKHYMLQLIKLYACFKIYMYMIIQI